MELFVLASIIIIAIALDWWDKNSNKVDTYFKQLPDRIRLKLKEIYSKLRRQ